MDNYDNDALLEMCSNIDLLEYAEQSMEFQGHDDSYSAHCPLHVDKTPSLKITPSKNLFYCFSCGCGGNIISWMMTFEGKSFTESVEKVAELTGGNVQALKQCDAMAFYKTIRSIVEENRQKETVERQVLDENILLNYEDKLPEEWIEEGIKPEIMKKYGIRIDTNSRRIIYPIWDNDGNLIGIKGRTQFVNYKVLKIMKYMNYFKLGTVDFFVGMKENRASIINKSQAIIFEGIKSGMKVEGWGYDNWLATETSALNEHQTKILIQLQIREVVIAYDNDVDIKKIKKSTKLLRKFTNVYVVCDRTSHFKLLPENKMSPCDAGQEVWETLFEERVRLN